MPRTPSKPTTKALTPQKPAQVAIAPSLIVVEGNISAGKTTLCEKLGYEMESTKVFKEPVSTNPYLTKFYAEPKKYALIMQLWLLRQRFETYLEAMRHVAETGESVVLDRSLFSDWVFAEKNRLDGNIDEAGFEEYTKLREEMLSMVPLPSALVYLDCPPEECYKRVHNLRCRVSCSCRRKLQARPPRSLDYTLSPRSPRTHTPSPPPAPHSARLPQTQDCEGGIPLEYLSGLHDCYKQLVVSMQESATCAAFSFEWASFGKASAVAKEIACKGGLAEVDWSSAYNRANTW